MIWHRVADEGFHWSLRGIFDDGSFYGTIHFRSHNPTLSRACSVEGQLSRGDLDRFTALCGSLTFAEPLPAAAYAILTSVAAGKDVGVFRYDRRDEETSAQAKAFLEVKRLLDPYIDSCWSRYYPDDGCQHGLAAKRDALP